MENQDVTGGHTQEAPSSDETVRAPSRSLTRRDAVKLGLAGGAALALGGSTADAWARGVIATGPNRGGATGPKRGGTLRVGIVGAGASETLNPNKQSPEVDLFRAHLLYERLVDFAPDGSLFNQLAQEFSASKDARTWKIKVRPGVVFHDGSPLTADDIVYSLRYIMNPKTASAGQSSLSFLKPQQVRKLDKRTVLLALDTPLATIPTILSARSLYMFKAGTKSFDVPNGTGPFKFKSWKAGERSLFVRHDGYRKHGGPYLDAVEIISINDQAARFNALAAGQIDANVSLDSKLIPRVEANPKLRLMNIPSGVYNAFAMWTDTAPFNDVRVRQAFRYVIDRKQMINIALGGQGKVGNDLACWLDPDYAGAIPQRAHDPEKARSLLKAAGKENLTVDHYTSDSASGQLQSSILFAEQAKQAGITVNIRQRPASDYWSAEYNTHPFWTSNWGYRPLDVQIAEGLNANAPYNETHWKRPDFDKLTTQARRTLDTKKRHELWVAAQQLLWDEGGYILWGFLNNVDAVSAKVRGITPSRVRPLGWYTLTDAYLVS